MGDHHIYDYQFDLKGDSGPARVVRLVGKGVDVLEIGSGPGAITKFLSGISQCRVTALDADERALAMVAPFCANAIRADLNDSTWSEALGVGARYDVVVAADVLEHLYQPLQVLRAMGQLLRPDGHIVLSLPHAAHSAVHACLLDEDFAYGDYGLLDRTHIRFFGLKNIQRLVREAGLGIAHAEYVVRDPESTEFAPQWRRLSHEIRTALASNPFGQVYQVILKLVPAERCAEDVDLLQLPVHAQVRSVRMRLRSFLQRLLPRWLYAQSRKLAVMLGVTK